MKTSAQQVQDTLRQLGYANQVVELPESTHTAQEAANAIGCSVPQIVKSIVFRLLPSEAPLLVAASGVNRVDEKKVSRLLNQKLGKADAEYVKNHTGFVIGGVPPVGHKEPLTVLIDEDLFQYNQLFAAAGHPKAVFALTPQELVSMTGGRVAAVK